MQQPPTNPYGYYGQPPRPPGQTPKALPHQRIWRWFRSRKMWLQVLIACLVLSCSLCTCVTSIAASSTPKTNIAQQSQATPTNTPTTVSNTNALDATATDTPTPTPTDTPTPTPTATATPTPKPTARPTQPPRPTPTPAPRCQAVNGNPWCYDFSPGNLIYTPPSGFCNYFACISSFYGSDDPGDGYIVECSDGSYSQSGGERGACSYHGGVMRALYSH